jgi:CRISPR-associated protein Cmr4
MFVDSNVMLIKAITPIHAGSGRALGLVDMPIQKEKHTGMPKIEGSSLKGSMRELYRINNGDKSEIDKLFGPEEGDISAGLLGFTDAKLLFYPVISINNLFSYITCPYLLNRYFEDLCLSKKGKNIKVPAILDGECVLLNDANDSGSSPMLNQHDKKDESKNNDKDKESSLILDQYSFEKVGSENLNEYEKIEKGIKNIGFEAGKNVVLISDEDFIEMISLCRDIITRNRIDHETGTVKRGGLFTEEYLPSESILYSLVLKNGIEDDSKNLYDEYIKSITGIVQIGGNATIGKGIARIKVVNFTEENNVGGERSGKDGEPKGGR